ncbi:MAG: hypothetical protein R3Y38_05860 [Rikenellaceae bacterium]
MMSQNILILLTVVVVALALGLLVSVQQCELLERECEFLRELNCAR